MSCAIDPSNQLVAWSYVSNSAVDDTPDKILVYNYAIQKWSLLNVRAELLAPLFTPAYTLENLDNISSSIDALPASMDSALYKGGAFFFGGSVDKKIHSFTGSTLEGTIETAEFPINVGRHSLVTRTVPYFRDGSVTMQVGARDRQDGTVSFDTAASLTDEGFCQHRSQGRFHRVRMNISGDWDFAQGVEIEGQSLADANFQPLPAEATNPRQISQVVNNVLTASSTAQVHSLARPAQQQPLSPTFGQARTASTLMPQTANAATEVGNGTVYVSNRAKQSSQSRTQTMLKPIELSDTSLLAEWERCGHYIEDALEYAQFSHTLEDVLRVVLAGDAQFWPESNAALVTEIIDYPQRRTLRFWLAGGVPRRCGI